MSSKILFIYEGKKTEPQICQSMQNHVFSDSLNVVVESVFNREIYQLYDKLREDPDLDIFTLLRDRAGSSLKGYKTDDFSEIYMFFDYDGHASTADNHKISDLLNMFNNETENGKLYISYPMVEALKHITTKEDFEELCVCCNKNIHYKNLVQQNCDKSLMQFSHYTLDTWKYLLSLHLKKMNYIVNDNFDLPTELISQSSIFVNQKSKYIVPKSEVAVLSSFPVFIYDYFGNKKTLEMIIP